MKTVNRISTAMRALFRLWRASRLILYEWRHPEAKEVKRHLQAIADAPGLPFVVGDRVKAVRHRTVDHAGGTGTVVAVGAWNDSIRRYQLKVRFDSFPRPLFMAAAELVYERT